MKKIYIAPCSAEYSVITPNMFAISQTENGANASKDDFVNTEGNVIDGGDVKEKNLWDTEW